MKCPGCGDEVVGGKCRFCGYRPTQADIDAAQKWEAQKARLENPKGQPDWKGERIPFHLPDRRPRTAKPRQAPPPKQAKQRPEQAPRAPARAQASGPGRVKAKRQKARKQKRPKKHGLLLGLLPRIIVLAWAALLVYLLLNALAAGP